MADQHNPTSARFSLRLTSCNLSFMCTMPGALQIAVVVTGLLCISLLGSAMSYNVQNTSSWLVWGFSFYAFLLFVSFWCFMTSAILLISCLISPTTASFLPTTGFYILYHVIAALFYFIGSLTLMVENGKDYKFTISNKDAFTKGVKTQVYIGGGVGAIATGLYAFISVITILKYIRSR